MSIDFVDQFFKSWELIPVNVSFCEVVACPNSYLSVWLSIDFLSNIFFLAPWLISCKVWVLILHNPKLLLICLFHWWVKYLCSRLRWLYLFTWKCLIGEWINDTSFQFLKLLICHGTPFNRELGLEGWLKIQDKHIFSLMWSLYLWWVFIHHWNYHLP